MFYQVDPSGSYWRWKASAIGKNMLNAKTFLEKRYVRLLRLKSYKTNPFSDTTKISSWRTPSTLLSSL